MLPEILENFQTLDVHMITHFTMNSTNYHCDICNSLKEQMKRDWVTLPLNSVTTLTKENLNKKVNKTIIITTSEKNSKLKKVKGKKDIQIVKIQAGAEVLVKEKQITKGLQNKMQKIIRTKNTLQLRNQEINTATRKISTNLGNSTLLQNNNNKKINMMWPYLNQSGTKKQKKDNKVKL